MKNADKWSPSIIEHRKGRLRVSNDPKQVSVASRLAVESGISRFEDAFKRFAKGRLLDLGCGKVPYYEAYHDYIDENICVDWDGSFHGNPYTDLECDLNQPLPFDNAEFDTILLSEVLEHITRPEALWHEMARVLKPDGCLILTAPFFYCLHEEPYDYCRYTEYALRRFCDENDMKIEILVSRGGVPEIMVDITSKTLIRLSKLGPKVLSWLGRITVVCLQAVMIRAVRVPPLSTISRITRNKFPLGYFLVARKSIRKD